MKSVALWIGCGVWFVAVTVAMLAVWAYKTTDNGSPEAPSQWPRDSALALDPTRPTLTMFAHPQCPCTRASLAELSRLADQLAGKAMIQIVLVRPPGSDASFDDGDMAERAARVPGAKLAVDVDARESTRFAAKTSGSVVLYSPHGALLFRGGITSARGHQGHAPSHDQILALVAGEAPFAQAPTFGCALDDPEARAVP